MSMFSCKRQHSQWRRNRNTTGGGAGVRDYKAADYPHEASACEGQKLGGGQKLGENPLAPPPSSAALEHSRVTTGIVMSTIKSYSYNNYYYTITGQGCGLISSFSWFKCTGKHMKSWHLMCTRLVRLVYHLLATLFYHFFLSRDITTSNMMEDNYISLYSLKHLYT